MWRSLCYRISKWEASEQQLVAARITSLFVRYAVVVSGSMDHHSNTSKTNLLSSSIHAKRPLCMPMHASPCMHGWVVNIDYNTILTRRNNS